MNRLLRLCLLASAVAGCGFLEQGPELDVFTFEEQTHGTTIQPVVDAAPFGADIVLFGQLNTPTPCYRLNAEFDDDDSDLHLRVVARPSSSNCEQIVGNYRYNGSIRNLDQGTYQLRVRHVFEGANWPEQVFNLPVTIR